MSNDQNIHLHLHLCFNELLFLYSQAQNDSRPSLFEISAVWLYQHADDIWPCGVYPNVNHGMFYVLRCVAQTHMGFTFCTK